jgi:hypothetical protein
MAAMPAQLVEKLGVHISQDLGRAKCCVSLSRDFQTLYLVWFSPRHQHAILKTNQAQHWVTEPFLMYAITRGKSSRFTFRGGIIVLTFPKVYPCKPYLGLAVLIRSSILMVEIYFPSYVTHGSSTNQDTAVADSSRP